MSITKSAAGSNSPSTLFILHKSWHDSVVLYEQIAFAQSGDTILLIQDAVLALQSKSTLASFLAKCEALKVNLAALSEDIQMRGIQPHSQQVRLIDYTGFVELVCEYDRQVSW